MFFCQDRCRRCPGPLKANNKQFLLIGLALVLRYCPGQGPPDLEVTQDLLVSIKVHGLTVRLAHSKPGGTSPWNCPWERRLQAGPDTSGRLRPVRSRQDGGAWFKTCAPRFKTCASRFKTCASRYKTCACRHKTCASRMITLRSEVFESNSNNAFLFTY